jgi:hypothetical protein
VYVSQPSGFKSLKYPDRVYKLSNALYGLKKVSQAWYARLKTFLLEHGYVMECVDKTLFTLNHGTDFLLFRFTWMISFLMALLTHLCLDFRK